jgi:hypothetical protein
MLGLKRRKRVEGWAVDVPGTNGDMEPRSVLQRLGDNNKAWLLCLAGIVILTLALIKMSDRTIGGDVAASEPRAIPSEYRDRGRYLQFEQDFRADKRFAEAVLEDRFLSPGRFQIVVSGGVSADEIDYVAKMAAERIRYLFGHKTVVQVYKRHAVTGAKILVAIVQWESKKGGYVVSFRSVSEPKR